MDIASLNQTRLFDVNVHTWAITSLQDEALFEVLGSFLSKNVRGVVFKGAHVANAYYEHPHHRPRADSDILVCEKDWERAKQSLIDLGYSEIPGVKGTLIRYQATFTRKYPNGFTNIIDLHWRVSDCQFFAKRIFFEELWDLGEPYRDLDDLIRVPRGDYAFLLASIHRAAHHRNLYDPVWIGDLVKFIEKGVSLRQVTELAIKKDARGIVKAHLEEIQNNVGLSTIGSHIQALKESLKHQPRDPSAILLNSDLSWYRQILFDLKSLETIIERLCLVHEYIFCTPERMSFGKKLIRGVTGCMKLFLRRPNEGRRTMQDGQCKRKTM